METEFKNAPTRKGEWLRMSDLSEQEDDRYKCSYCGNVVHHKSRMDLYTFNSWCGRCGSDNGRKEDEIILDRSNSPTTIYEKKGGPNDMLDLSDFLFAFRQG